MTLIRRVGLAHDRVPLRLFLVPGGPRPRVQCSDYHSPRCVSVKLDPSVDVGRWLVAPSLRADSPDVDRLLMISSWAYVMDLVPF